METADTPSFSSRTAITGVQTKPISLVVNKTRDNPSNGANSKPVPIEKLASGDRIALVFGNLKIMDNIIRRVIITPENKLDKPAAKILRLVNKSWLRAVTSFLHRDINKAYLPFETEKKLLFVLSSRSGSFHETSASRNLHPSGHANSILTDFIFRFLDSPDLVRPQRMPPFLMITDGNFFTTENYQKLIQVIKRCADGLVELRILRGAPDNTLIISRDKMPTNLYLPHLKTLHLEIENLDNLHGLITGARHLRTLTMSLHKGTMPSLRNTFLPASLQELNITFGSVVHGNDLAVIFHRNRFPILQVLKISNNYAGTLVNAGIMVDVLKGISFTLDTLILQNCGTGCINLISVSKPLRALKNLEVSHWDLYDKGIGAPNLDHLFPNLNSFKLTTTKSQLEQWMKRSAVFEKVDKVQVKIFDDLDLSRKEIPLPQAVNVRSLTQQQVQIIQAKFVNVVHLSISICGPVLEGLRGVFQDMCQIKKLEIQVHYDQVAEPRTSVPWDALFVGVTTRKSVQLRAAYRKAMETTDWREFSSVNYNSSTSSIVNLWNLETLAVSLADESNLNSENTCRYEEDRPHFLTDISFALAFFKMVHLKNMRLFLDKACYHLSETILSEWKKLKGNNIKFDRE